MKNIDKDFDLVNLPVEAQDPEIKQEDFTLQQADGSIHEQKFQTKPTTFLKDSLKRFRKNKSSVVATYILGALILLAIFVPIFNKNDVSTASHGAYANLQPKLFESGTGWWDGTKHVDHCPVDGVTLMPDEESYLPGGVTNKVIDGEQYTNTANKFGKEGYLQLGYYSTTDKKEAYLSSFESKGLEEKNYFVLDLEKVHLTVTDFNVVDLTKLTAFEGNRKKSYQIPENFDLGSISLQFVYDDGETHVFDVIESKEVHNIGLDVESWHLDPSVYTDTDPVDITQTIIDLSGKTTFNNFYFQLKVVKSDGPQTYDNVCSLVRSLVIAPSFADEDYEDAAKVSRYFSTEADTSGATGISFTDAMQFVYRPNKVGTSTATKSNPGYWSIISETKYLKRVYMGRTVFASFDYDSYAATLGPRVITVFSSDFEHYKAMKWVDFYFPINRNEETGLIEIDVNDPLYRPFTIRAGKEKLCPVLDDHDEWTFDISRVYVDQKDVEGNYVWSIKVKVLFYRYLDETKTEMPKFLFGTDKTGRDMFKYVFEGLRNSLALGVVTFLVCFTFGLIWGAVSGYFGGVVDLAMERFTDILSGIPWIVVMTLIILKAGKSTFGVFALALCLTGWIGTASTTRTQFYRFRGREYVLASRTLGASDARLIAKHILPNALGTIITGAVLMIPSVIFSEATISYLGLGFKNLSSLGVILSDNQAELTNHPYQLIFPSVVIALVMISFNLFGNGLRDAINPSLKGEDE